MMILESCLTAYNSFFNDPPSTLLMWSRQISDVIEHALATKSGFHTRIKRMCVCQSARLTRRSWIGHVPSFDGATLTHEFHCQHIILLETITCVYTIIAEHRPECLPGGSRPTRHQLPRRPQTWKKNQETCDINLRNSTDRGLPADYRKNWKRKAILCSAQGSEGRRASNQSKQVQRH